MVDQPGRGVRRHGRALALAGLLAIAGCGDDGTLAPATAPPPELTVAADPALRAPLTACARDYADATVRLRFAGSSVPVRGSDVVVAGRDALPAAKTGATISIASDGSATYAAAVVDGAKRPEAAEAFVDDLLAGGCHAALREAGFGEP